MTLPDERYRAVTRAELFLKQLCNPQITPRVPAHIRREAAAILRHYPSSYDLDRASESGAQHVFQKRMEPLYRMVLEKSLEDQVDEDYQSQSSRS
jgi:hypothetical protein